MARFRLGINYWPRSSAMYMWRRFDRGEIAEDFAQAAALGIDSVRFFLSWDAFAPAIDSIDRTMLAKLVEVMDCARDAGLAAMPTLFTGHMSGVNWLPSWSLGPDTRAQRFRTITERGQSPLGVGDIYADEGLLAAQKLFARRAGEVLRDHPALWCWDLGNETSNVRVPRRARDAAAWSAILSAELEDASAKPVTAGTHGEDLTEDRRLRLSSLCEPFGFATMHGYSAYSSFARDRLDPNVVPFLFELARAFSRKPVCFTELGNPACAPHTHPALSSGGIPCLTEEEMADYARGVVTRLHARGSLGAFWWCWSDYAPSLAAQPPFDLAPHEFRFGMVRADGSPKPVALEIAAFAREKPEVVEDTAPMHFDEDAYYAGLPQALQSAYARYCDLRP